jgi:hypothetical protein
VSATRSIAAIARADFRERTRRYSFFLALLFAIFLGYATATGKVFIQFDEYRGIYTSAWIGSLVALVITCFLSLAGFYIVKNSIERDRVTGVGQILAATPLSKISYAFGKFFSNLVLLYSMVGVLAVAALVMQFLVREDPRLDLWALLSPFALIALPPMALTAALAVAFEMLPGLRGSFGNIAWFFVWNAMLVTPIVSHQNWLDPTGLITVFNSISAGAKQYVPNYHGGMAFQIDVGQHLHVVQDWRWLGIAWTGDLILLRLMWIAVACALVAIATIAFDRFDSTGSIAAVSTGKGRRAPASVTQSAIANAAAPSRALVHLTPLSVTARSSAFLRIFLAEFRLAVHGLRWWWYLVAAGLLVAQFAAPLAASRGPLLGSAWLWTVFLWSPMGAREARYSTRALLFSCARILPRQVLACYLAGFCIAVVMGAGAALRLAVAHDFGALVPWIAGAVLLPATALALGILSGSSKPFEALLTLAWYVGPMNSTPGLDFTGASSGSHAATYAFIYVALAALCLILGLAVRSTQLRSL